MVLCEMYHARQSPRPVLIKFLQKSSFIGQISQYFPAREVCDWSVLTKLSLCMGLVPLVRANFFCGSSTITNLIPITFLQNKKTARETRAHIAFPYVWSSHIYMYIVRRDQLGEVANPARGQLNRKNEYSMCPFAPENLISRDGFDCPAPCQPAHCPHSGWNWFLPTGFLLISAATSMCLYSTAICHRASPEFFWSHNCVPMAFTAESPPAQGQYFQ